MTRGFSERMSELRRRKGASQRTAAAELGISQALLSHYENGAREPGLDFVCRACDYYGVSADYLLCRSDEQDAAALAARTVEELCKGVRGLIDSAQGVFDKLK